MISLSVASLRMPPEAAVLPRCYANVRAPSTVAALAITVVRIPIAMAGVALVARGIPTWALAAFVLFALLDVVDGVAARSVGVDTANRRIADVLIDRVAIHAAFWASCYATGHGWQLWFVLLLRDVLQGVFNINFIARTKLIVIGAYWHMAYGFAMLLTVACLLLLGDVPVAGVVLAWTVAAATLIDYIRGALTVERSLA